MCVSSEGPHSSAGAEAAAMVVGASYGRDLAPDPTPKDAQISIRSGGPTRHVCEVSCLGAVSGPRSRNGGNRHFAPLCCPSGPTVTFGNLAKVAKSLPNPSWTLGVRFQWLGVPKVPLTHLVYTRCNYRTVGLAITSGEMSAWQGKSSQILDPPVAVLYTN